MTRTSAKTKPFNVAIVGQAGRLQYEALLFVASLRHSCPDFSEKILVAEPQPGPLWSRDPRMAADIRAKLEELGAQIVPFENTHFGQSYPNGNKIEMLRELPEKEPFVFFDTDTLITGDLASVPFDFDCPAGSLRREGTWPKPELYGPGYTEIWRSLYALFDLDFERSLDLSQPEEYWRRHMYFNAGYFYFRCPREFGSRFEQFASTIKNKPPTTLACQSLDPWLDQVALPLVVSSFGGKQHALPQGYLDGPVSCHYRLLPLLYARESDHVIEILETIAAPNKLKKLLKGSEAIKRMVYQGRGRKVRELFDQNNLPRREQAIRNQIKRAGFWIR